MRREATQGESGERSLLAAHLPAIYPRDHRLPDEPSPLSTRTPETPLYDSLTTNLPLPVMTFTSQNAAPGAWLFPHHQEVNKYLHDYEQRFDLKKFITFNTLVSRAIWDRETKLWELSLQKSGEPSSQSLEYFDHLLVCNGHYAKPYSPDFEGLGLWAAHESRSVIHSMWYREPSPYQDLRVLVIGGGPSGNDISSDISEVAKETIQSVRSFQDGQAGRITQRGAIDRTEDGSFSRVANKHIAQFNGTVQLWLAPVSSITAPIPLMSPFPPSSLAFFGLPSKVAPFPLFEAQALLARVMTGRVRIDFGKEYRIAALRNSKLLEASGYSAERAAKAWHVLDTPEAQFGYREHLWRLAGEPDKTVPAWTELYDKKFVIRDGWRELVKRGEATLGRKVSRRVILMNG
ncbi:flavin-containing monooxygenase/FMO family protein [Ceratobasidium sp. AG-Ba]|nr:flavin-containing monooxygenase/FMO family protein [Ceratobasidium sp. AG-Ba]